MSVFFTLSPNVPQSMCLALSLLLSPLHPLTHRAILDELQMVLDEEAETFVLKLWRLLIYETEARKRHLTEY